MNADNILDARDRFTAKPAEVEAKQEAAGERYFDELATHAGEFFRRMVDAAQKNGGAGAAAVITAGEAEVLDQIYSGDRDLMARGVDRIRNAFAYAAGPVKATLFRQLDEIGALASVGAHRALMHAAWDIEKRQRAASKAKQERSLI